MNVRPRNPVTGSASRGFVTTIDVLVVDDNADAADALVDVLNLEGYRARACYSEPHAFVVARDTGPQIVIVDIGMPERGGHVLARQIRHMLPGALLIAFTGFSRADDVERSLNAGIDEHWVKPMGVAAFAAALRNAWARHARA